MSYVTVTTYKHCNVLHYAQAPSYICYNIMLRMHMLLYQWAHHDESIHMLERSCELHNSNYAHVVISMGTS